MKIALSFLLCCYVVCQQDVIPVKTKFIQVAVIPKDVDKFINSHQIAIILFKAENLKKDIIVEPLEVASADDSNLNLFDKIFEFLRHPLDIFRSEEETTKGIQKKSIEERIKDKIKEFKLDLMEIDLTTPELNILKSSYGIKTLPLLIVYKSSEISLREVN